MKKKKPELTEAKAKVNVEQLVSKLAKQLHEIGLKASNTRLQKTHPGRKMYEWNQLDPWVITGMKAMARFILKNYKAC